MDDKQDTSADTLNQLTSMTPNFGISARGFSDVDSATRLATITGEVVRVLGNKFDLSGLDGVTIAVDYNQALLELDRGYETTFKLTATNSHVAGVAMTPAVLRGDVLKSHIVVNAGHIWPLLELDDVEGRAHAIHVLAHECGHVEVTNAFDRCFPNVLLRPKYGPILEQLQWKVILSVWDEYAVTMISAPFGESQTESYENSFLNDLALVDAQSNKLILEFRRHLSVEQILGEIYGCYGTLLKFAAYHLGNLQGLGISWHNSEKTALALHGHWFLPYFERLGDACQEIAKDFGKWTDTASFFLIAGIIDDLVYRAGLLIETKGDRLLVDIPYTAETDPLLLK